MSERTKVRLGAWASVYFLQNTRGSKNAYSEKIMNATNLRERKENVCTVYETEISRGNKKSFFFPNLYYDNILEEKKKTRR